MAGVEQTKIMITPICPSHWKYAVCLGVPMEWDVVLGNPQLGTSWMHTTVFQCCSPVEGALKYMGYASRANTPKSGYDLVCPPYMVDAGVGEHCRAGFVITPETGSNCRTAVVLTSLEMETRQTDRIRCQRIL